eukprot:TRINITY_DN17483_c0_g1_i1.p1 TRINITY_DN17483_c0_g1~~TRINITY_DN17483_c0_g1_i1.p1  ORF type:complete len:446 (-),score=89.36 TRINITY_DN17483_c0_g1_i1:92-1429(-)
MTSIPIPQQKDNMIVGGSPIDTNAFVIGSPPLEYALLRSIKVSSSPSSKSISSNKNTTTTIVQTTTTSHTQIISSEIETTADDVVSDLFIHQTSRPAQEDLIQMTPKTNRVVNQINQMVKMTERGLQDPTFRIRICCGRGNRPLSENIVNLLNLELEACKIGDFADGELNISIDNNVRGEDVYIIQPICPPDVHTRLMELLLLIHTLHLSSAKRITAIIPYFAYSRQDRKILPRTPISASAVAQLIEAMRPHQIVMVDLHHGQIQGFFQDVPSDNLIPEKEFVKYCLNKNFDLSKTVMVSPDAGGVYRAKSAADALGVNTVVTILKRKIGENYEMQLAGEVSGLTCMIIDDIIDTGATIIEASRLLKEKGALGIYVFATHGVFSDDALEKLNESSFDEVCVTDSLPQHQNLLRCPKLRVFSLANLLAEVIERLHFGISLANLRKQ